MTACRAQAGFTLLEVLVAVAILGVIATTLFGSFSRTVATRDYAQARAAVFAAGRRAVDLIEEDLGGTFATGAFGNEFDPPPPRFFADGDAEMSSTDTAVVVLDFTALSSRGTTPLDGIGAPPPFGIDRGDLTRIVYRLERPDSDFNSRAFDPSSEELQLVRYEMRPPTSQIEEAGLRSVIAHNVRGLSLRMRAPLGGWQSDWQSDVGADGGRAPIIVQTRLRLAAAEGPEAEFVSAAYLAAATIQ